MKEMVSKSIIQTFSYPISKAEMIEEATKMAKADGVSFSVFIISLLEQEVRKKAEGSENPIGVLYNIYNNPKQKGLQSDIRNFMRRNDIIKIAKDLTSQECDIIASNLLRVSRFKREGVIEV